MKKCNLYIV